MAALMDLELDDDQVALRDAARAVLADACPRSLVRAVVEGTDDAARDGLWRTLVELDWPALGIDEAHGGLGLGPVEFGVVVEELGRVVAPTPFLATVTQLVPLLREAGSPRIADVASGAITGALALADGNGGGVALHARASGGWRLDGTAQHVLDGATADEVAVVGSDGEGAVGVVLVEAAAVSPAPLDVIDPTLPMAHLDLTGVVVPEERVLVAPGDPRASTIVARAVEEATAMMALSTVATCRTIFETTVAYAQEREQFGRPIGSFQAVKHRLADCYLAVERAASLCWFAVTAVAEDDPQRTVAVSMAKAAAGECQQLLVRDGLQLHGGVGFTWEHDLHLALKRALAGDLLLGTAAHHRARLAVLLGLVDGTDGTTTTAAPAKVAATTRTGVT